MRRPSLIWNSSFHGASRRTDSRCVRRPGAEALFAPRRTAVQACLCPEEMQKAQQRHARLAGSWASRGFGFAGGRFIRGDCWTLLQADLQLDLDGAVVEFLNHPAPVRTEPGQAGVNAVVRAVLAVLWAGFGKACQVEAIGVGSAMDR